MMTVMKLESRSRIRMHCALQLAFGTLAHSSFASTPTGEELFQAGRLALARGDAREACVAFERSAELEAAVGTLLNLGRCHELLGEISTARLAFLRASELAKASGDQRSTMAALEATRLFRAAPKIMIELLGEFPGAQVFIDGTSLTSTRPILPLPVDPGAHFVEVRLPGLTRLERVLWLELGETEHVLFEAPVMSSPPATRTTGVVSKAHPVEPAGTPWSPRQWLGIGAVTLGAVGCATSLGFGISAMLDANAADCDTQQRCSPEGVAARRTASSQLSRAYDIGIPSAAIGVGGLIAFLWPTSTTPHQANVAVGRDSFTLTFGSQF